MRDRLDFSAQLLFDLVEVEPVFIRHQVDRQAEMTKASRAADTMKVGFAILGEIKVNHHVYGLNIDTASEEVGTDEVATHAITEIMKDTVAVRLEHFGMRIKARVAKLGDLFGQEFDSIGRVAENDRLINLKLYALHEDMA